MSTECNCDQKAHIPDEHRWECPRNLLNRLHVVEATLAAIAKLPRYMRMQQPHKFGRFVYYDDVEALIKGDGSE